MISRSRSDFWCFHRDVLRFVLVFWLRSVGIFRSLPSGKLVSQTSRLGIRPALPTVQTQGAHPATKSPDHTTSFRGYAKNPWLSILFCRFSNRKNLRDLHDNVDLVHFTLFSR